jgi:hypothetical protein
LKVKRVICKKKCNSSIFVFEFKLFVCCSIASDIQTIFVVLFLTYPMIQKMLKSMKIWASYTLSKWKGWFAKTKHNNSVCVFEFKLFVHFSITFDIQKHFFNSLFDTSNTIIKKSIWWRNEKDMFIESEVGWFKHELMT